MAQPASLSGADGIRSLKDNDAVFRAFDSYPWTKDKTFMSGLNAILGDPNSPNPQGSPTDMATHARIFYYSQRIGVSIDFATYQSWLSQTPDHQPPNILPEEYRENASDDTSASSLAWQQAAPKAELYVDRGAASAASNSEGDQPSYPMAFAEMIKLLQEGKEVPGIKQIPNTIIRDPSVKPVGTRTAPKKPWEKDTVSTEAYSIASMDTEFPPIDPDISQASTEA